MGIVAQITGAGCRLKGVAAVVGVEGRHHGAGRQLVELRPVSSEEHTNGRGRAHLGDVPVGLDAGALCLAIIINDRSLDDGGLVADASNWHGFDEAAPYGPAQVIP
mgnify:CR=1 FL=1